MDNISGNHLLQAFFAPPIVLGGVLAALVAWVWQGWDLREFRGRSNLTGIVCLIGRAGEMIVRPGLLLSIAPPLLLGALLGSVFNTLSHPFTVYTACLGGGGFTPQGVWQDNNGPCFGGMWAQVVRLADLPNLLFLAGAILGAARLASLPKIRVRASAGTLEWQCWFRKRRVVSEECLHVEVVTEIKVYYGAGHLVDLEKNVERKTEIELVLKDGGRFRLGGTSGKDAHRRAAAVSQAVAAAIGVPVRSGP